MNGRRWPWAKGRGPSTRSGADGRLLRRTRWQLVAWSAASTFVVLLVLGSGLYLAIERQLRTESEDRLQRRAAVLGQRVPSVARWTAVTGPEGWQVARLPGAGGLGCWSTGVPGDASGPTASPPPTPSPGPVASAPPDDMTAARPCAFGDAGHPPVGTGDAIRFDVVADPAMPGLVIGGPVSGTLAFVVRPFPAAPDAAPEDEPGSTGARRVFHEDVFLGTPMRLLSTRVDLAGQPVEVRVVEDRSVELGTLQATLAVLLGGGAAAVLAAGALGHRYAGRALVPIRDSLRRQREFAADASHELRTPLTVIRSSIRSLRHDASRPPEEQQALDDIDAEAERMAGLVDQLLLLARADSGAQEVEMLATDLAQEASDALEPLVRVAQGRDVSLELDVAPAPVTGDPMRLRQVVGILVDNAVRHAPAGGHVRVAVALREGTATLTVDDDGPGVRPEDRQRVFDRFWRAPDAPPGGSGLGLAIAAWIVGRHGGRIAVGERPGGGARFAVELPAG